MKKKSAISHEELLAEKKANLVNTIKNAEAIFGNKKITAGFDGFIDTIVRIIKKKKNQAPHSFFTTIKQFGDYITEKQAASFSLEIEEQSLKPGGNMPITANALGSLGIKVNCIGALGFPQTHPIFSNLSPNCHVYSFAQPGTSTAFEFNDGKMFLGQMASLNTAGWEEIKNKIGIEKLAWLYHESDLICLLNWSEIDASTDIWKGLLTDIFPGYSSAKKQIVFADLSDCSKRSNASILEALELLKEFSRYSDVMLSLNRNEAGILYKALFQKKAGKDLQKSGQKLFDNLGIHTVLIHSSKEVVAFRGDEQVIQKTFFTGEPKISTGAGDNFNAGFCAAQLLDLDLASAVLFANAVSGLYIRTGMSAQPKDIIEFLEKQ